MFSLSAKFLLKSFLDTFNFVTGDSAFIWELEPMGEVRELEEAGFDCFWSKKEDF